jgi:hypothetical protein
VIMKFFLHVSKEEQLSRFKLRLRIHPGAGRSVKPTTRSVNTGTSTSMRWRTCCTEPAPGMRPGLLFLQTVNVPRPGGLADHHSYARGSGHEATSTVG